MAKKVILIIGLISFALIGCMRVGVKGNGNIVEEKRTIEKFEVLDLSGAFDVVYETNNTPNLIINGESNLLKYIEINNIGSKLIIKTKKNIKTSKKIVIYITNPSIKEANISGANNLTIKDLKNEEFFINLSGAGNININGSANYIKAKISGAGRLNSIDLQSKEVDVEISGTASADVYVSEKLDAKVSGVGSVNYYGNPKVVNNNVSGIGSINKK
ncbi:MAG TPA: head GIN domain-containing protein [Melioribacteraceae bacterium]|nr:head GIN domain-containing protein [Melioribacteraceae bacterium]